MRRGTARAGECQHGEWHESSLPATACDHECRHRVGGCLDSVVICCASEQSSRLHAGHVGRGALMQQIAWTIVATAVRYASRGASS